MGMSLKKVLPAFSFVFIWIITQLLAFKPNWTEQFYSKGIYLIISKLCRYAFGWIPFSIGDILYTIGGILFLRWLFKNWKRSYKDFKNWGIELLTGISIIYTAFHCFWAFNYYRQPLHTALNIGSTYTTEELILVSKQLIDSANKAHRAVQQNDTLKVEVPYSKQQILKMTEDGYRALSKDFPNFKYQPSSIKASIYSLPLTYMGFSGYLNPFTNEAQVDILIPKYQLPSTASHEVAHQLGYAAENEANFIGMLACMQHSDPYFNYSGHLFGLRYCLSELYVRDKNQFKVLRDQVKPGIFKNFQESSDFWNNYKNPIEPLFKSTYNSYLKANNQEKGIESYSYAVALIVNYFNSSDN